LKINENSEYWTKIFNEMATVSEELEIYKKRVLELEEKLKKSEELLLEIQNSSGQNVLELQKKLAELKNQFSDLENSKESLVSEKEKMVSELLEKIEKLEDEIRECVEKKPQTGNLSDDPDRVITFEDNIDVWKDRETGLFWEVKKRENIKHKYVWKKENIENARNPKLNTDDVKDAFSYAEKLNSENYGGFSDWRVPTLVELKTLLGEKADQFGIDIYKLYIKKPLILTTHHSYCSSTENNSNSSYSWIVNFSNGNDRYSNQTNSYYVRCVR